MSSQKVVLVVEDQFDNRQIACAYLAHLGYEVLEAEDGREGLRIARRDRPDLIVMDISMPELDGLAAVRLLKADPELRSIPTIAFSAHVLDEARDAAMSAGFDAFLMKPLDPKALAAEIQRWIGAA